MSNRVFVTLDVKDNGSKVLSGFARLVDQTGSKLDQFGSKGNSAFSGMQGSIAGGVLQANLLMSALNAGIGVAQNLGSAIKDAFAEAAQSQLDDVGLAADISSITGKAFSATQEEMRKISTEVERAGNAFGANDKMTAEATTGFLDNIYAANEAMGRGVDAVTKDAANLLPKIAVMAEKSNFSASEASRYSAQFVDGVLTEGQLKNLDFFNRNKLFMKSVGDYLQANGKKLKDLSDEERYTLFQAGVNATVTDDYIKNAAKTLKGVWSSFEGSLFGKNLGLFSLARDLDLETDGDQSAIAAAGEALNALLGPEGIIPSLGAIFGKLTGLDDKSYLNTLRSGFLRVSGWLGGIADFLNVIEEKALVPLKIDGLGDIGKYLSRGIGSLLDKAGEALSNVDAAGIGSFLSEGLRQLESFIQNLDYAYLGRQWGELLAQSMNLVGGIIVNIDWSSVPPILLRAALGSLHLLGTLLIGAVTTFDWGMPIQGFFSTFQNLFNSLTGLLMVSWEPVINAVTSAFSTAAKWIDSQTGGLVSAAGNLFNRIFGFFNDLINRIPGISASPANTSTFNVASRANGHLPSTPTGNLIRAAIQERSQMPSGSSLAVANSSEAILNRAQQSALVSRLGGQSANVSLSIGNINIQAGDRDAASLADQVIQQLEFKFQQFSRNKLSVLAT